MATSEEISEYRSKVIEKAINLDWLINAIISMYYFKQPIYEFMYDVLYDEYFSFGLRRRILEKIAEAINEKSQDSINKLNRMNTIRNYFAHCHNTITVAGKTQFIPDPRDKTKPIDFEKLYSEFIKNEKIVLTYLGGIYKGLGGPFYKTPPSK